MFVYLRTSKIVSVSVAVYVETSLFVASGFGIILICCVFHVISSFVFEGSV